MVIPMRVATVRLAAIEQRERDDLVKSNSVITAAEGLPRDLIGAGMRPEVVYT
jgi:hypothetical protein